MHVKQMRFHNKRVCVECGLLRAANLRQCPWCRANTQTREPRVGDRIPDRQGLARECGANESGVDRSRAREPGGEEARREAAQDTSAGSASGVAPGHTQNPRPGMGAAGEPRERTPRRQPRGDARVADDEQARDATALIHWGDRGEGGRYWKLAVPERHMAVPEDLEKRAANLGNSTLEYVPAALLTRFAVTWAESMEGALTGDELWGKLARV